LVFLAGKVDFQQGLWIGVKYDEPLGKNDGRYVHISFQIFKLVSVQIAVLWVVTYIMDKCSVAV
jgi:hypothetical protein